MLPAIFKIFENRMQWIRCAYLVNYNELDYLVVSDSPLKYKLNVSVGWRGSRLNARSTEFTYINDLFSLIFIGRLILLTCIAVTLKNYNN